MGWPGARVCVAVGVNVGWPGPSVGVAVVVAEAVAVRVGVLVGSAMMKGKAFETLSAATP